MFRKGNFNCPASPTAWFWLFYRKGCFAGFTLTSKRLCALFNSRNLIYYIMGELIFSLAFYLTERKQGHRLPKNPVHQIWNGSTFRSHSSSNYFSQLSVLDAVSGQLVQHTEVWRYIPAKEYQLEWQPFFSCHQKWGSKCFAQPSVIF